MSGAEINIKYCKIPWKDKSKINEFDSLRPGICFETRWARSLIPPTEHACDGDSILNQLQSQIRGGKFIIPKKSDSSDCFQLEVWDALRVSLKLHSEDCHALLYENGIPQAYFVSPYGVFSHCVATNSSLLSISEDLPMYRWEASSYFQAFINGEINVPKKEQDNVHVTRAYLDLAGLGLVRTYCTTVKDEQGKVVGIICADDQIDVKELLEDAGKEKEYTSQRFTTWSNNICQYYFWEKK